MKKIIMALMVAFLWLSLIGISSAKDKNDCYPGTGTPGYWMNHPEAWPVYEIEIGGVVYDIDEAIELMGSPVSGDKWFTMFPALVAAKLNVMIGNCSPNCCITGADTWMAEYTGGITADSDAWQDEGEYLYLCLDKYNNGKGCAPSRDEFE